MSIWTPSMLFILIFLSATFGPNVAHAMNNLSLESTRISAIIAKTQWKLAVKKIYSSLAWRRFKSMAFHVTMLTAFVLSKIWYYGKGIMVTIFFLATYPVFSYCPQIIYWWSIILLTLAFMYVDLVRIILKAMDTRDRLKERDKYMIILSPTLYVKLITWVIETYIYFWHTKLKIIIWDKI